jgi:hypothetical protein
LVAKAAATPTPILINPAVTALIPGIKNGAAMPAKAATAATGASGFFSNGCFLWGVSVESIKPFFPSLRCVALTATVAPFLSVQHPPTANHDTSVPQLAVYFKYSNVGIARIIHLGPYAVCHLAAVKFCNTIAVHAVNILVFESRQLYVQLMGKKMADKLPAVHLFIRYADIIGHACHWSCHGNNPGNVNVV